MANEPRASKKIVSVNLLLLSLVTALFFLNFYQRTMFFRPVSHHQWRQADCLSIAKNYYEEGMNFFRPVIHYQGVEGGKAVGECPILNYTGAALWKIFGEHEFIYRLMEYLIFLAAVFVLFNTLYRYTGSVWLSVFAASVMLTSPLLAYYSLNFMSDVPALSMAVMCFCVLFHFVRSGRQMYFYLAIVAGTIGVLMKASALIPLCLALLTGVASVTGRVMTVPAFSRKWPAIIAMIVACTTVFLWYRFAVVYNAFDRNNIFLLTLFPIWEMDLPEILRKLKILFNVQLPLLLNTPMLFLILMCAAYVISRFSHLEAILKWAFVISGLYVPAYILSFFWVFDVHDYYLINVFIFPAITLFCTALLLSRNGTGTTTPFLRIFFGGTIILNSLHAAAVYRLRMIDRDPMLAWYPFINREEIAFAEYLFWDNSRDVKRVENLTPVLRARGIDRTDRVLSIPDHSFNVTLYLMDQKGYTVARDHIMNDTTVMDRFMNKVDYIVLSDTALKDQIAFRRTSHNFTRYFTHGPVNIYKLNHVR